MQTEIVRAKLKKGREKTVLRCHPWLFSGAVESIEGEVSSGCTVEICSSSGEFLGYAAYSPSSQIRFRFWSFDKTDKIDISFFRRRLEGAIHIRDELPEISDCSAIRLVNAESDGLPGLIVDRYADFIVCQFLSAGAERWRDEIVNELQSIFRDRNKPLSGIYERSDSAVREKEGLSLRTGLLAGTEPPGLVEIEEPSGIFLVDIQKGHKTGFYLDQRENRTLLMRYAKGKDVLNCFSYTGGFGVSALRGGAKHVLNIDSSEDSLTLAGQNLLKNGFKNDQFENRTGDVFLELRKFRDEGRAFDLIVLDPPKFAESKERLHSAARGYKDINLLAFKLLRPGGVLFTFSCSSHMDSDLFQKVIFGASLDAGRNSRILEKMWQSPDHGISLNFPEGDYLKGLVCRAD